MYGWLTNGVGAPFTELHLEDVVLRSASSHNKLILGNTTPTPTPAALYVQSNRVGVGGLPQTESQLHVHGLFTADRSHVQQLTVGDGDMNVGTGSVVCKVPVVSHAGYRRLLYSWPGVPVLAFYPDAKCVVLPLAFMRQLIANYSWLTIGEGAGMLVAGTIGDPDSGRCLIFLDMNAQQRERLRSFLPTYSGMPLPLSAQQQSAQQQVHIQVHASLTDPVQELEAQAAPLLVLDVDQDPTDPAAHQLSIQVLDSTVFEACLVASKLCCIASSRGDICVNVCELVQATPTQLTLDIVVTGVEELRPGLAFLVPLQGGPALAPVEQEGPRRFAMRATPSSGPCLVVFTPSPPPLQGMKSVTMGDGPRGARVPVRGVEYDTARQHLVLFANVTRVLPAAGAAEMFYYQYWGQPFHVLAASLAASSCLALVMVPDSVMLIRQFEGGYLVLASGAILQVLSVPDAGQVVYVQARSPEEAQRLLTQLGTAVFGALVRPILVPADAGGGAAFERELTLVGDLAFCAPTPPGLPLTPLFLQGARNVQDPDTGAAVPQLVIRSAKDGATKVSVGDHTTTIDTELVVQQQVTAEEFRLPSDIRLKRDVQVSAPQEDLAKLLEIPVHAYRFKHSPSVPRKGVLAHEVQAVVPEAVREVLDFCADLCCQVDLTSAHSFQATSKQLPLLLAVLLPGTQVKCKPPAACTVIVTITGADPDSGAFSFSPALILSTTTTQQQLFLVGTRCAYQVVDYDHLFCMALNALKALAKEKKEITHTN